MRDFFALPPSAPILLSHPMISGSVPPAHEISMSFRPRSSRPLAHTAANASPTCLNGTSAVARFGFLGGAGFSAITISEVSTAPNWASKGNSASAVVIVGCAARVTLARMVVSRVPVRHDQLNVL